MANDNLVTRDELERFGAELVRGMFEFLTPGGGTVPQHAQIEGKAANPSAQLEGDRAGEEEHD